MSRKKTDFYVEHTAYNLCSDRSTNSERWKFPSIYPAVRGTFKKSEHDDRIDLVLRFKWRHKIDRAKEKNVVTRRFVIFLILLDFSSPVLELCLWRKNKVLKSWRVLQLPWIRLLRLSNSELDRFLADPPGPLLSAQPDQVRLTSYRTNRNDRRYNPLCSVGGADGISTGPSTKSLTNCIADSK